MKMKGFNLYFVLAVLGIALLSGCTSQTPDGGSSASQDGVGIKALLNTELTDVATGEKFRIGDFKGKPVLVESFAVWCSTCLEQQRKIKELKARDGETIVHVSLDTDPNEDASKIKNHIDTHGFDWYFAVAPIEMTQALIDQFSLDIVNAPAVPVLLVCEDQSVRLLRKGIKPADELLSEVSKGC